jgi:predicted component of type VI protein secretion system
MAWMTKSCICQESSATPAPSQYHLYEFVRAIEVTQPMPQPSGATSQASRAVRGSGCIALVRLVKDISERKIGACRIIKNPFIRLGRNGSLSVRRQALHLDPMELAYRLTRKI